MEIHSTATMATQAEVDRIKAAHKPVKTETFADPVREFTRNYPLESTVRNWLTLPVEERKRLIRDDFRFIPRDKTGESESVFDQRMRDRRLALCLIIAEEARAQAGVRSPEVAAGALKQLFPDHDFSGRSQTPPVRK